MLRLAPLGDNAQDPSLHPNGVGSSRFSSDIPQLTWEALASAFRQLDTADQHLLCKSKATPEELGVYGDEEDIDDEDIETGGRGRLEIHLCIARLAELPLWGRPGDRDSHAVRLAAGFVISPERSTDNGGEQSRQGTAEPQVRESAGVRYANTSDGNKVRSSSLKVAVASLQSVNQQQPQAFALVQQLHDHPRIGSGCGDAWWGNNGSSSGGEGGGDFVGHFIADDTTDGSDCSMTPVVWLLWVPDPSGVDLESVAMDSMYVDRKEPRLVCAS